MCTPTFVDFFLFHLFFSLFVSLIFYFLSSFLFSLLEGSLLHFFPPFFFIRSLLDSSVPRSFLIYFFFIGSFFILVNGAIVTVFPQPPRYINFFEAFHFLAGDQQVVPTGASHISLRLQEIQSRVWEKKNKRTICSGSFKRKKGVMQHCISCVHMYTNASVDSSENSTTLLGMPTHLDRSSFTGAGLTHADWSLCYPE